MRTGFAQAPQVTLKLQQQLPAAAPVPKNFLAPWAQKVEKESGGRIKIELYPSMQLGGTPPQVFDQVKDGVIDLTWTLPGYTPNRFPEIRSVRTAVYRQATASRTAPRPGSFTRSISRTSSRT